MTNVINAQSITIQALANVLAPLVSSNTQGTITALQQSISTETTRALAAELVLSTGLASTIQLNTPISAAVTGQPGTSGTGTIPKTYAQVAAADGGLVPLAYFENQGGLSTGGLYLSAQSAAAAGAGTYTPTALGTKKILQAAWNASSKDNPVRIPAGLYSVGTNNLLWTPGMYVEMHELAIVESTGSFTGVNALVGVASPNTTTTYDGGTLIGGTFRRKGILTDFYSGLITTLADADTSVYSGDWTGVTTIGTFQPSSTFLFVKGTSTIPVDAIPAPYASLAAWQAAQVGAVLHSNRYINYGSTIASIDVGTGGPAYIVTLTNVNGKPCIGQSYPGPQAAIPPRAATSISPGRGPVPAVPGATFYVLSAAPVLYSGRTFAIYGHRNRIERTAVAQFKGSDAFYIGGDYWRLRNVVIRNSDGNGGATAIRLFGGRNFRAVDCDVVAGDDAFQAVPGAGASSSGVFQPWSNMDIIDFAYRGGRAASLSARACDAVCAVTNTNQEKLWQVSSNAAYNNIGNVLTFDPGTIPTGLTIVHLQASNASNPTFVFDYTNTAPNSYVDGTTIITNNDSTISMTLVPPAGVTNAILVKLPTTAKIAFLDGVGPYAMTCSISGGFYDVDAFSYATPTCSAQNSDSQGTIDVAFVNVVMEQGGAIDSAGTPGGVLNLRGGAGGGIIARVVNCKMLNPLSHAMESSGNILRLEMTDNLFDQPKSSTGANANVDLQGALSGYMRGGIAWGYVSDPTPAINLGGVAGIDPLGNTNQNTTLNFIISDVTLKGTPGSNPAMLIDYADNIAVRGLTVQQAATLGAGSGRGIGTTANTGTVYVDGGNFKGIDGTVIKNAGGTVYLSGNVMFNPAPYFGGSVGTQTKVSLTPETQVALSAYIAALPAPTATGQLGVSGNQVVVG